MSDDPDRRPTVVELVALVLLALFVVAGVLISAGAIP